MFQTPIFQIVVRDGSTGTAYTQQCTDQQCDLLASHMSHGGHERPQLWYSEGSYCSLMAAICLVVHYPDFTDGHMEVFVASLPSLQP